jgi:hypothetical protein
LSRRRRTQAAPASPTPAPSRRSIGSRRRTRERDAANRQGDADEEEEENSDGGGSEYDEEEEVEEPVMCLLCLGTVIGEDDYVLICCKKWCGQAAHRSCTGEKEYDTPSSTLRNTHPTPSLRETLDEP